MEDYMVKMPWPTPIKLDESSDESDTMELDAAAVIDNVTASPVSQPSEQPRVPFAQPAPPASPLFDDSSIDTSIAFENLPAVEMVALEFCTNSQPPSPRLDSHSSCSSLDGLAPNKDQLRKPMSTVNDAVAQFLAIKKERLSLQRRSELSLQRSLQWELETTHHCKDSLPSEPSVATTTTTTTTTTTARELPEPVPVQPIEENFRQKLPAKKRRIAYTPPAAATAMPSLQAPFRQEEPQRDVVPPWRGEQSDEVLTAAAAIMGLFPTMPSPSKPDVSRREHGAILPRVEPVVTIKRRAKSPRKPRKAPKQVPAAQPTLNHHRLSTTAPFVVTLAPPTDRRFKPLPYTVPTAGTFTSYPFSSKPLECVL
jgi:hypothetical protein